MQKHKPNKERQAKLEPTRMRVAREAFEALGLVVTTEGRALKFKHQGREVMYFPYTGWATGKTITDGRGLQPLLDQLKKV